MWVERNKHSIPAACQWSEYPKQPPWICPEQACRGRGWQREGPFTQIPADALKYATSLLLTCFLDFAGAAFRYAAGDICGLLLGQYNKAQLAPCTMLVIPGCLKANC